ncbi:helix-turn-helix domain-containing protein [Nesterenkonia muleiensis]|uniref:helix-turn-helix domain-containing protein n=1 Tax=Nesterenkonia muleiensis TaxID=2282648 RepID=UPI000E758907|nr:helix-turn-helix domain-containing protein [Nesterenkonia muleiensis]
MHPQKYNPPDEPRLYTVAEVAHLLHLSQWTIAKLIREQEIRSVKIGARRLIAQEDLEDYVQSLRGVASPSSAQEAHHG